MGAVWLGRVGSLWAQSCPCHSPRLWEHRDPCPNHWGQGDLEVLEQGDGVSPGQPGESLVICSVLGSQHCLLGLPYLSYPQSHIEVRPGYGYPHTAGGGGGQQSEKCPHFPASWGAAPKSSASAPRPPRPPSQTVTSHPQPHHSTAVLNPAEQLNTCHLYATGTSSPRHRWANAGPGHGHEW